MTSKITLITPPDIYENSNFSIAFLGINEDGQSAASLWLGQHEFPDINFYYYQGEDDINWLFHALNRSDAIYLDFDTSNSIVQLLGSYILSKPGVYYSTKNSSVKELMGYINNQFVPNIQTFLERVLDGKE